MLSVVWPGTPTAPGMDRPAPGSSPAARGREGRRGNEETTRSEQLPHVHQTFPSFGVRRARRQDVKYGDPWSQCPVTEDGEFPLSDMKSLYIR